MAEMFIAGNIIAVISSTFIAGKRLDIHKF